MRYNKIHFLHIASIVLVLFSLILVSCTKRESNVDIATKEKILLVGNQSEPVNLDPAFTTSTHDFYILQAIFEGLLIFDPQTLELQPAIATHWNVSEDGKTYTFHLRQNAKFSNGDPITAHNFIFSIKRILSPKLGSPNAEYLLDIVNAKDYHSEKLTDFDKVGVKALDDYTLEFKLLHPNPFFTTIIAYPFMSPLHEATLKKFHAVDSMNGDWMRPANTITNGPFVISEWRTNDYLEVRKNPYYWNKDIVKLNKIRFYPTPINDQDRAFRGGQLHIATDISQQQAIQYQRKHDPNYHSFEINAVYFYQLNPQKPPLNDVRVRKALSLAINRKQLVNEVLKDNRKPAYNIVSGVITDYHPIKLLQENITTAKELLAQAGYPNGENFPELQITCNVDSNHLDIAQLIQAMWKKNLNINVKIENTEWKIFLTKQENGDFDIIRGGWVSNRMDPWDSLVIFKSNSSIFHMRWNNLEYDRLLDSALEVPDIPTRFKILAQAEAFLLNEFVILPLVFYVNRNLVHPSVHGWAFNPVDVNYYQFIDLVPLTTETQKP